MFERFTDRARRVLVIAQEESREFHHAFIGTEHILLGLIREGEGVAARALESLNITFEAASEKVEEAVGRSTQPSPGSPPFTPRAKKLMELALREALQLGHSYIGTEHLLLGLIREGDGVATQVLTQLGVDPGFLAQQVMQMINGTPRESAAYVEERAISIPGSPDVISMASARDPGAAVLLRLLWNAGMIREPANEAESAIWNELTRRFPPTSESH